MYIYRACGKESFFTCKGVNAVNYTWCARLYEEVEGLSAWTGVHVSGKDATDVLL
jgi:hypothetical protein